MKDPVPAPIDDVVAPKQGGIVRRAGRLVTLPFRIAGVVVRALVGVVTILVVVVAVPIRVAAGVIRKVVAVAADLTYALWQGVLKIVGLVLGVLKLVLRFLNGTIGLALRVVWRTVRTALRTTIWAFSLVKFAGAKQAKKQAKKTATGDTVVDLAA